MSIIEKFIASLRRKSSERQINREISRVFAHMHQRADHDYPFSSPEELTKERMRGFLTASKFLRDLEQAGDNMPTAQGEAFRYIAYRDLNARLKAYVQLAKEGAYNPTPENHQLTVSPA